MMSAQRGGRGAAPAAAPGAPAAPPVEAVLQPGAAQIVVTSPTLKSGEAMPKQHGTNGFRRALYRGPAPPPGAAHQYHFFVYALDQPIEQKPHTGPMTRNDLIDAAKGHIIGKGELVATYERH